MNYDMKHFYTGIICKLLLLFVAVTFESRAQAYYPDLINNLSSTITLPDNYTVNQAQNFINEFRKKENSVLGTNLPMITFPGQSTWNNMSIDQRFFWLINKERADRGLVPYSHILPQLDAISQYYADYLRTNNKFVHNADGKTSTQRIASVTGYNTCNDFSPYSENLYYSASTSAYNPWAEIDAITYWLYKDDCCGWGHRRALLYKNMNDNSGKAGEEGFIGLGISKGSFNPSGTTYAFSTVIVFNFFDPCASWNYTASGLNTITGTVTSTNETSFEQPFIITPNPFTDIIHFPKAASFTIFSQYGTFVHDQQEPLLEVNLAHLSAGLYFIIVPGSGSFKVIKQ